MANNNAITLAEGLNDVYSLVAIWNAVNPTAQPKLKVVIENKIQGLRNAQRASEQDPKPEKYSLLQNLTKLGADLRRLGFQTDAVDDTILEEM